jgi:hypothetical protein
VDCGRLEETSIQVFRAMQKHQGQPKILEHLNPSNCSQHKLIDPLYFILPKRHAEEESRHDNYAFMMLDLYHQMPKSWVQKFLSKIDNLLSELLPGPWMITELMKIMKVKKLHQDSEFFRVLASCLPLLEQVSKVEFAQGFYRRNPAKWRKKFGPPSNQGRQKCIHR